jgi:hypothetical protein
VVVGSAIYALSDVTADGSYVPTLQITDDRAVTFDDHRQAVEYAMFVMTAAELADYDAAVFRQATSMGMDRPVAAHMVAELRNRRPPIPDEATAPLRFVSIVTLKGKPAVQIFLDGEPFGQWSPGSARRHAQQVLRAVLAAELDGVFYRYAVDVLGVDEPSSRALVTDLARHRPRGGGRG